MKFLLFALLISGLASLGHGTDPMQFGKGTFLVTSPSDFLCKAFSFDTAFTSSATLAVQLALHMDEGAPTYEAAVSWVEHVNVTGFTACVTASGPISGNRRVSVQWLAYNGVTKGAQGKESLSKWTAGTRCITVNFFLSSGKTFTSTPYVFVTASHSQGLRNRHDAASVWAEDVTQNGLKICLRELKNFDGEHTGLSADWLATEEVPTGWEVPYESVVTLPNTGSMLSAQRYSFCKTVNFTKPFFSMPVMITTARHHSDLNNPNHVKPENNAITEWIEEVTLENFKVCMKDIQPFAGHHDPVSISYMAVGYLNPCENVQCTHYATCKAYGPKDARCECPTTCDEYDDPRCGSDGNTYKNLCYYQRYICNSHANVTIVHLGACYPFILHRGRVALDLSTTDVKCQLVIYATQNFMAGRTVHVQASINYFDSPQTSFVHEAAVTWAEKISINNFTVCALKSGRNDRITPDNGRTYVDYIAYQGAPAGSVAGEVILSDWWQETKCKDVSLPSGKFSVTPRMLVTSEHMAEGQKHDAATIWVESPTAQTMKVCLRELQNFDGLHKDIHVNWIAYSGLPSDMNSEQTSLLFENTNLPKVEDNYAYCQIGNLAGNYTTAPNVLVTAVHSTFPGSVTIPEYNSISAWIEYITTTTYRVCIKELHTPNGYDPVVVSILALGS